MEPTLPIALFLASASFLGFVIGVWFKALSFNRDRMLQHELWSRKLKLVEADRNEATDALNSMSVQVETLRASIGEHSDALEDTLGQLENSRNSRGELMRLLSERDDLLAERGIETAQHESRMDEAQAKVQERQEELERMRVEDEELREELEQSEANVAEMANRMRDLERVQAERDELEAEVQDMNARNAYLILENDDRGLVLRESQAKLRRMDGRLGQIDRLGEDIEERDVQLTDMQARAKEHERERESLREEVDARQQTIAELEQQLAAIEGLQQT
ncbi:MAG: chromosome segregation ATPase, partial [Planctomycetota bacterium]